MLPSSAPSGSAAPKRELSLFDATCIIVGIVVGSGIFRSPPEIAANAGGLGWLLFGWVLGGLIALVGSLVYAELAVAYPQDGGEYVYLTRAYGRRAGIIYCWAQLLIIRPGNVGAVAFIFAAYAQELYPLGNPAAAPLVYAVAAISFTTLINILGVREGKWTQNLLTTAKVLGLLAICLAALFSGSNETPDAVGPASRAPSPQPGFILAMILIMFTYGGWNDMPLVAAEVRDPRRNLVRALVLGALTTTTIYLLVNLAYLSVLGYSGLVASEAVAADVLSSWLGKWGGRAVSVLVCISCLGAINGMVLTGSRIYYAMGRDHRLFRSIGTWNARLDSPVRALLIQGAISIAVVVGFSAFEDGFNRMVIFTNPPFFIMLLFVGLGLFILRRKDREKPRSFSVPFYPLTPILYCLSSAAMLYYSLQYCLGVVQEGLDVHKPHWEAFWALGILAIGVVFSVFSKDEPASEE
jgi:amino acid transporter